MLSMPATTASSPSVRRLVLVPAAAPATSARGDELVRRYRLARCRLEGRQAAAAPRHVPRLRGS
jgi:hypothetical protein